MSYRLVDRIEAINAELAQLDIQTAWLAIGIERANEHGITPMDYGSATSEKLRYLVALLHARMNNLEVERQLLKSNLTS